MRTTEESIESCSGELDEEEEEEEDPTEIVRPREETFESGLPEKNFSFHE